MMHRKRESLTVTFVKTKSKSKIVVQCCLLIGLVLAACETTDKGAAEFGWIIRDKNRGNSCCAWEDINPIYSLKGVRLCWAAVSDNTQSGTCMPMHEVDFACHLGFGLTPFMIDPGKQSFWVEPVCRDGNPPDKRLYDVPASIVRDVVASRAVSLDVLQITVDPCACRHVQADDQEDLVCQPPAEGISLSCTQ